MKVQFRFLAPAVALLIFISGGLHAETPECRALAAVSSEGVVLNTVMMAADAQVTSRYCLVTGVMAQRMGVDDQFYSIQFELRLPNSWLGRFAYQFNDNDGSQGGELAPALGRITGQESAKYAINQGFAVVSGNSVLSSTAQGSTVQDMTVNSELRLGSNIVFGHDPEARRDYGYGAVEKLNPVARQLIEHYYQAPIQYAYGLGQSNGGRMAMVAASRFPNMFNGLIAGSPGFNAPKAALQHPWDVQALHRVNDNISQALSPRDLTFFAYHLLKQCDGLDGLNDDMIFATEACQTVFNPKALVCKSNFDRDCLSLNKVAALIRMHKGPHNAKNQALYASWPYDTGIRSVNWRFWKIESRFLAWDAKPAAVVIGATALAHLYTTPFFDISGGVYALEKYLQTFDFDKDAPKIYATNAVFNESAMTLMTPPDVMKPQLNAFKQQGGKMLLFHGNSDPVFSVYDTLRWYDDLNFMHEGRAAEFVRLYRIPGMPHGQGGASADQFDVLQPLISWVEHNQPSEAIIAKTRLNNPEITARMSGMSRPLCPHPAYAKYNQGDFLKASSFQCVVEK